MTAVTLVHVGDFRESYYREAEAEFVKRLQSFCRFKTVCIPEERIADEDSRPLIDRALAAEAVRIRAAVPPHAVCVALCVEGRQMTSERFAEWLESRIPEGSLCFIVGSSFGLDEDLKKACALRLSLSEMTFPHRLARLLLEEQLYRAFSISAGKRYHK